MKRLALVVALALVGCSPSVDIDKAEQEAMKPDPRAMIADLDRRIARLEGVAPLPELQPAKPEPRVDERPVGRQVYLPR